MMNGNEGGRKIVRYKKGGAWILDSPLNSLGMAT